MTPTEQIAPGVPLGDREIVSPVPDEDWFVQLLRRSTAGKLYGTLSFTFQGGRVTVAKVEQSLKPPKE